jgi:hypothetical protein
MRLPSRILHAAALAAALCACGRSPSVGPTASSGGAVPPAAPAEAPSRPPSPADGELEACNARIDALRGEREVAGAPAFEAQRVAILGRARGEPMLFTREPAPVDEAVLSASVRASRDAFERGRPGGRVVSLRGRHKHDRAALRALVLREGYVYASEPLDALALVTHLRLADLFDEPEIVLQRGADTRTLERTTKLREVTYRYADGPLAGRAADLLFGDRVAVTREALGTPLHRDLRGLAEREGFDRARIERHAERGIAARLRFGDRWVRALLTARGAALELACIAEDRSTREALAGERARAAPLHRSLRAMRATVTEQLDEAFRFDRPEGEKTAERDGELRPVWATAYLQGRQWYDFEGTTFPVFDPAGRPWPPQVCVDFVLDTFERTAGTWFDARGSKPRRVKGRLDFDEAGIKNRRGVLAFGKFAEASPELFEVRRFEGAERIQFRERARYFGFLTEHADLVRPGDVVAIHGLKADEKVHQHAILVEASDPITGFPYGLADQMKKPRRRTWEGIMAEAPLRSLLYRVRPREAVFARVDPGEEVRAVW